MSWTVGTLKLPGAIEADVELSLRSGVARLAFVADGPGSPTRTSGAGVSELEIVHERVEFFGHLGIAAHVRRKETTMDNELYLALVQAFGGAYKRPTNDERVIIRYTR